MSTRRIKMSKFRLKMDMSEFYDDERNLAYILVDPKWEQVVCLQEHVEKLFDVPHVHFLTDDGVYIPPLESIDIIKSSDVLRAIFPQRLKKKKKSKTRSYDGFGDEPVAENSIEIKGEKRKYYDDTLTCSTPNPQPKKKQRVSKKEHTTARTEVVHGLQQCIIDSDMVTSTNNTSNGVDKTKEVFVHPAEENEETAKSRKRKRIRKKKKQDEDVEVDEKSNRLSSVPVPISSSTLRLSKSMSTPNQSPKHVHFDEDATLMQQNGETQKDSVVFWCHLDMDGTLKPREIAAEEEEENCHKKPEILIHENIVLVPAKDVSCEHEEQNDSSVIEVEDSVIRLDPEEQEKDVETTATERPAQVSSPSINVEKILPLSEPLLDLPNVGDIVLFKMYRLDEANSPEITDYICGRCEEVDSTKRTVSCFVLDGHDQVCEAPTMFNGDGVTTNGRSSRIQLFLDELLEKKVFRMS